VAGVRGAVQEAAKLQEKTAVLAAAALALMHIEEGVVQFNPRKTAESVESYSMETQAVVAEHMQHQPRAAAVQEPLEEFLLVQA